MDKLCALIEPIGNWLTTRDEVPVIFANSYRRESRNTPMPFAGIVYQEGSICPWWEVGGRRHAFPPDHLAVLSGHGGSRSGTPRGKGQLWICTFDLGSWPDFEPWAANYRWVAEPIRDPAALVARFQQVSRAYLERGPSRRWRLKAAVLELLAAIFDEREQARPGHSPNLEQARQFMHDHYRDPDLNLPRIAGAAGLSLHHFGRAFRQAMGLTPKRYLTVLRLRQARTLLETSALRINEIAGEVGYRDPLHFSRVFRAETGHSPRAWRQERESKHISPAKRQSRQG